MLTGEYSWNQDVIDLLKHAEMNGKGCHFILFCMNTPQNVGYEWDSKTLLRQKTEGKPSIRFWRKFKMYIILYNKVIILIELLNTYL